MRCRAGASNISSEAGIIIEPGQTVEFRPLPSENEKFTLCQKVKL
jgi:hypothetical protein